MQNSILHEINYKGNVWSIQQEGDRKKLVQNNESVCELIDNLGENKCRLVPTTQALLLHQENKMGLLKSQSSTLYLINLENKKSIHQGKLWDYFTPKISSSRGFRIQNNLMVHYPDDLMNKCWNVTKISPCSFQIFKAEHFTIPQICLIDERVLHSSWSELKEITEAFLDDEKIFEFSGKLRFSGIYKGKPLVIASKKLQYAYYWDGNQEEEEGTLEKIQLGKKICLTYNLDVPKMNLFFEKSYKFHSRL